MPRLQLVGPCPEWHPAAQRGLLHAPDGGSHPILAVVGAEVGPDALERARARAAPRLALARPGVLPLLDVLPVGRRLAWVYPDLPGLGLGHLVGAEAREVLPLEAAAEIVAQLASVLFADDVGPPHPGPGPDDVLLTDDGSVHLAGFVGPFPRSPAMHAPQQGSGPAAQVYRLGVLLATLLSGCEPSGASDPVAHQTMVRRALIRAMARPGPGLPERHRDWVVGMMAWDPDDRPPPSRIAEGLRLTGDASAETLRRWASSRVPLLRDAVRRGPVARGPEDPGAPQTPAPRPVLDGLSTLPGDIRISARLPDDPTAESPLVPRPPRPSLAPTDRGAIPVGVGPPPEAARRKPQLPDDFLTHEVSREPPPPDLTTPLLILTSLVLIVLGVGFALYLF